MLIWVAGCVSAEHHETDVRGMRQHPCGDAVAPRLARTALPSGELADECMMQWVRKGTPFSLGTYAPPEADLVDVGDGHLLRSKAADAFRRLQAAAAAAGHTIVAVSGYRSHERQVRTHETWVQRRLAKARGAISREKAEREVGEFSARAGHSEHQLGTTVDVSVPEQNPFNHDGGPSAFATSCAGKWVRDNAHRFGFTMSYPYGREQITCLTSEPWHFRYVGVTIATRLLERGISLEEYFREQHPAVGVPASVHCPDTRESLRYDVPALQDCTTP
jgi:LAS superfamily LD-carboxypeptidase LdcB